MTTSEIILPKHLECIYKGESYKIADSCLINPILVILIDSTECSTCSISKLIRYTNLQAEADSSKSFTLLPLLSPKKAEIEDIREYLLLDYTYPIPVYIDTGSTFRKLNTVIPDDIRFHRFLIDKDRRPVFVGDPVSGNRMMELFKNALQNL